MQMKQLRIVNKFRFVYSLVIILLVSYCCYSTIFKINIAEGTNELKCVKIHIKYGDTLWELAKKFTPKEKDIRKTIYEISIINELDSLDLYPGQIIKIPIDADQ
ncbi:LysM peptidoglycan-binding domain-containing protein [Crassaminicella profunda]|uniref:LysM peptidoglycan-binding domain-containing protein n=1 Tax=Crassaminicella profunda TaxID=1286698 RepID=UPI001CA629C5|nr:LysM peptidoglycan-binding domain-containing protein [Crassaminicella profunda]QZY56940.1 LysM peptidoglycan-binding domain-containing protein [Crassaminicella profunda]